MFHNGEEESDPDPDPAPSTNGRKPLRNDDFVYVAPTHAYRLPVAQASRYWRKGMRAVFVTDVPSESLPQELLANSAAHRETWAWYPNFRHMPNGKREHYTEGDRRAALAPALAYAMLANPNLLAPYTNVPVPVHELEAGAGNASAAGASPSSTGPSGAVAPAAMARAKSGVRLSKLIAARSAAALSAMGVSTPSLVAAVEQAADAVAAKSQEGASKEQKAAVVPEKDPFQWMLLGDDDTLFFMRGVKALLRDYDPQLPYFISDSMYVGSRSPQPGVWEMRCYPCHLPWGRWRRAGSRRLMAGEKEPAPAPGQGCGCGCSTEALCKKRFPGVNETRCQTEWEGPVPYGGVGFILSIGLLKKLAAVQNGDGLHAFEKCINAPEETCMSFPEGGDAYMARCLWRLGFPVTDPGYTPFGRYFGEILTPQLLYEAPRNLTQGVLPDKAMERWSTAVTMHLSARFLKSTKVAGLTIKYISGVYDLVGELLWPTHS
ncbi:hypothetical protein HYH02_009052 [Chlamydomonas schloesseri]|uniref:Uncharacterized protein n=1 Tax=Chlamydomonas schloesseri TaxID=2026947 RepID=A0A836B0E4_9CHLO|nr:hypothetical protein HYH02_009052 [Chlamydomonas schloesseri]|eukprot:KAG2444110.1 hypothetical protein HYH02_009052 [Chlamydomonas schloesseri]